MEKYEPTYWNNKGKFKTEYVALTDKLVPNQDEALSTHGEILRIVGNVYYDIYNNGGGNIDNHYFASRCAWLVANVHPSMRKSAEKFVAIRQKHLNPKTMRFMDAFVDYIIKYVEWQDKSSEELKSLALQAEWKN